MEEVQIGLERLRDSGALQKTIRGNVALLCHGASVDSNFCHAASILKDLFGGRLKSLFGPQHGLLCDVQDNMVETEDFIHPHYKLPVHSLYGKTRTPTDESLAGIDSLVVDLQDVGTRVYTYTATLAEALKVCARLGIGVVVLDRPNPVGGLVVEGPILQDAFRSFVGPLALPLRHGLTLGEVALFAQESEAIPVDITVIEMDNWKRPYLWDDLRRPWINPSPNLPTPASTITFCGTVLFEGTNLSEGRGTTRSLELVGHPLVANPWAFQENIQDEFAHWGLSGEFALRPTVFRPMFQKHRDKTCGGFHLHPLKRDARSWRAGQFLLAVFKRALGEHFSWSTGPYEYEEKILPIDLINGTNSLREWVDGGQGLEEFEALASVGHEDFLDQREGILLYRG